ncbi:MAG: exodeoxyribonuclease VII large subunit [Candidatus Omnitrophica bacterium]|nr:exodeoxyribonuclease VII large subunit [Candidatus Omnitrophota bacterium]
MRDTKSVEYPPISSGASKAKIYTVSQLNREIRSVLESRYPAVWVEGEISNFKRHSSGHMYFTLKDEQAQVSAVFFSRLNQLVKFEPKDGLKVLAFGRVSLYESRGQYQLYVELLEPKGLGALQLAFQQLKEKLEREGLFRAEHKKPIPKFPKVVGVVTSPTGAAIRDILNVVNRRFRGTQLLLNPVRVQGEGAGQEIARAIGEMNELGGIDVLIVGRGGGSLEDLWAFNEEAVARAIYHSRIPVISAVGHEIDWTICDLAADLRAPTPSAAAELVVQNREELENKVAELKSRMCNAIRNFLGSAKDRVNTLETSYGFKYPHHLMEQFAQRFDELVRQFQNYAKTLVARKEQEFQSALARLQALSPLAVLERGYSLTFTGDGILLKDAGKVKVGDGILTRLARGRLRAKITDIDLKEESNHD